MYTCLLASKCSALYWPGNHPSAAGSAATCKAEQKEDTSFLHECQRTSAWDFSGKPH